MHVVVEGSNWWVVTDFASENPTSYTWIRMNRELEKAIARNPGRNAEGILSTLRASGTVIEYWSEAIHNNPDFEKVTGILEVGCKDRIMTTSQQCQGNCYWKGYSIAIAYADDDDKTPGQCWCARDCHGFGPNNRRHYTLFKWFEGFFYDEGEQNVYILAYTAADDLVINIWVEYEDDCGNEGYGKVEIWIAPSVEAAAAQGRSCDEADGDLQFYDDATFRNSGNVVAVGPSDETPGTNRGIDGTILANFGQQLGSSSDGGSGFGGGGPQFGGGGAPSFGGGGASFGGRGR